MGQGHLNSTCVVYIGKLLEIVIDIGGVSGLAKGGLDL